MEFLYSDINGKYKITGFSGECEIIETPDNINGITVTEIGDEAFISSKVKEVILNPSLEYIGKSAFARCSALEKVNIPPKS